MNISLIVPERITIPTRLFLVGALFSGLADGVLSVVLQLYIKSVGYESTAIGSMFTMSFICATIVTIPLGFIANRFGKSKVVTLGLTLGCLSIPLIISTSRIEMLLLAFSFLGMNIATYMVLDPLFSTFFDSEEMDKAFGFMVSLNIISYSVGSLFGYIPKILEANYGFNLQQSYRVVIMLAALFLALKLFFFIMSIRKSGEPMRREKFKFRIVSKRVVAKLCILFAIGRIGFSIFFNLFPYYVNSKFGIQSDALGTLFFISHTSIGISSIIASKFSDKMGSLKAISVSMAACVPFYLLIALSPDFKWLSIFWILRSLIGNLSAPLIISLSMKLLYNDERVSANSILTIATNSGMAAGTWIGGYLMENVSLDLPCYLGGGFYGLFAVLSNLLLKKEEEPER